MDDEPDVLELLEELLPMCVVVKASSFSEAEEQLGKQHFDLAVLDIMGVDGYRLLEIAKEKNVPAVMLTANALSPEDTVKSFKAGADLYVPKDKMAEIETYLEDVLQAREEKKSTWWRWLDRLGSYYDEAFEKDWQYKDKEFWKKFPYA